MQKGAVSIWQSHRGTVIIKYRIFCITIGKRKYGNEAQYFIAEPGKSEHHLGTAIDITDASIGYAAVDTRFGESAGGVWMKENAHAYGFVMSYPEGLEEKTGYHYEPWHWRFVGAEVAAALRNQGKTINDLTAVIPGKPYPHPNHTIQEGLTLTANTAIAVFTDTQKTRTVLLQKGKERRVPIASITKLMTAVVASDIFNSDDRITINNSVLTGKGSFRKIYERRDNFI